LNDARKKSVLKQNKGQSNLAKGDIARVTVLYAKQILLISYVIFARWQHASRNWSLGPSFWGKGRS